MGTRNLDIPKALVQLDKAGPHSLHRCAHFVRLAIEAGNVKLIECPIFAKDYGPCLTRAGFVEVTALGYKPLAGDVIVFQSYKGGSHAGHIEMYDGNQWVSDFKQPSKDIWPGPGYRNTKAKHVIYRP